MSNKILNEYYRAYLKKVSKENIGKYHEQKFEKGANNRKKKKMANMVT